jgi:outer membrane immunogenic protein
VVVGLETDMQWSGVQAWHQATTAGGFTPNGFIYTDTPNALTWFGTTRARIGYARGSSLLYATGGVAYCELTANGSQISGGLFSGSGARTQAGWAVGTGTEYALTEKLSLKAEYLYTSFNALSGPAVGIAPVPFMGSFTTGRFATQVTRVGLNWRFGGAMLAPAVLR